MILFVFMKNDQIVLDMLKWACYKRAIMCVAQSHLFRGAWTLLVATVMAAQTPPPIPPQFREVIVVSKTHFDIGYTRRIEAVISQYRSQMMDTALATLEASRSLPQAERFLWTLPGWPMTRVLDERQVPDRRVRVLDAFREGRFAVHGLAFTTHTESLEIEDLVRSLGFSTRLARSVNAPLPRAAKMTDVPSHSWILPTLLRNAGIEFLHLGCNGMSAPAKVPLLFWWEGPDGSRVLTMYSQLYGTDIEPPANWPYRTWLAMYMTGDNHGPPTAAEVTKLMDRARKNLPGITVRFGKLEDFADAIAKEGGKIPVVRGDMPDTWIHGINSMPQESALAHRARPAIFAAEALNTLTNIWMGRPLQSAKIAHAYENSLLFGEHTWGMNTQLFGGRVYGADWERARSAGLYADWEASWKDKGEYAVKADTAAREILNDDLASLAAAVRMAGPRIVVFNPVAWKRNAVVRVKAPPAAGWKDAETGRLIASSTVDGILQLIAEDLPPLGYRTYTPIATIPAKRSHARSSAENVLSNGVLKVTLDPKTASISSIKDMRNGRELVDARQGIGFGRFGYERFDPTEVAAYIKAYTGGARTHTGANLVDFGKPNLPQHEHERILLKDANIHIEQDATGSRAVMEARPDPRLAETVVITVDLTKGQPYVDLTWSIRNKKADPWPESGWLAFPTALTKPEYRLMRLGGIVDPQRDTVPGTNQDFYCLNGGLVAKDRSGRGLGILPFDSQIVSLGRPGDWRYSENYASSHPVIYVNLFNNQWGTNFQQWIGGSWSSTVRVWPVRNEREADVLAENSIEWRGEAVAAVADGAGGTLPLTRAGITVSRKGVQVTAFGSNPDGEGTVLRLWELSGQSGPVTVSLPVGWTNERGAAVTLRGVRVAGAPASLASGGVSIDLRANAPASILFEMKR
jgi:alpha-mannosidase